MKWSFCDFCFIVFSEIQTYFNEKNEINLEKVTGIKV